jgi:hypothetical protein
MEPVLAARFGFAISPVLVTSSEKEFELMIVKQNLFLYIAFLYLSLELH